MNRNQSYGSFVVEKGTSHTCTPVCMRFYKNRFPAFALWNIVLIVNGGSCSSLSNLQHLTFLHFPHFFHSIFLKPWRCLWPVSAPSVMWVLSGSAWLGCGPSPGPSHLARRASRPGLSSLEAYIMFSLGPGESLYAFITPSVGKGAGSLFQRCLCHLVLLQVSHSALVKWSER